MNKEQALKRLDELEGKVDEKLASEKALRLGAEKEVDNLRKANELLQKGSDALERRALEQAEEIKALQQKLDGYGDLAKALGKIRGDAADPEQVRKVVQEELAKGGGRGDVDLVRTRTTVHVREEKRELPEIPTTTPDGKILMLAKDGKLDAWTRPRAIIDAFPHIPPQSVRDALDRLVERELLVKKKETGSSNVVYSKHPDVEYA